MKYGSDWIGHIGHRVGGNFVLGRQILIVQLAIFVVHSESGANNRLSVLRRRPDQAHARIEVAIVLVAEAGAHAAESLRPAGVEIEGIGLAVRLME